MVSLVEDRNLIKTAYKQESRSGSHPRSLKTPYPRFSDARVGLRFYDNKVGRWTTQDPIGIKGGVNQYVFCYNNPVNFTDPTGLVFYGNYCGSGGSGTPIDGLDTACQSHDACYTKCGVAGASGVAKGGACTRACDAQLCADAKAATCATKKCKAAKCWIISTMCTLQGIK